MTGPAGRLVALAAAMGVDLDPGPAGAMVAVLDLMALEEQNVSAIDPFEGAIERHLADSLSGLTLGAIRRAAALVDLGSGGGFPGAPLAIAMPDCAVTFVESERKKADWIARATRDLPNVRVVAGRSETLAGTERERWAVVTARAVAPLPATIELAAPLLAVGGSLVVWRGERDAGEEHRGDLAAAQLGLAPGVVTVVEPFPGARRHLHEYRKTAPTPERFPRRPGRATKRPLA